LAVCLAAPWIDERLYWLGWIGLGGFMTFRGSVARKEAIVWTLLYSIAALSIAFHWAPGAMAYTIDGSLFLGTLVMLPILLAEAARLALPFLLVQGRSTSFPYRSGMEERSACLAAIPRWIWLAVIAVALETVVPTVFPWRLGYLQAGAPVLNQLASVIGPSATTFSVFSLAAICGGVMPSKSLRRRRPQLACLAARMERREVWTAAVFVALNLAFGVWTIHSWGERLEVCPKRGFALVQVDPSYTDSLDKMRRLTRRVSGDTDLVCWPESSLGCYSVELTDFTDRKRLLRNSRMPLRGEAPMRSPNCEILAGGKSYEGPQRSDSPAMVSAYLIDRRERILGRYDKTRLMPFGEYVPGAQIIPGLTTLFGFGERPALTGKEPRALTTSWGGRIGAMMCYEDLIPSVSRDLVQDGAEVLIVMINGVAFDSPHALLQHRQLARLRAVENRRYLLRTASTGSTCVVDPLGRIVAELPVHTEGTLEVEVGLLGGHTPFNHFGDVSGWLCVFASSIWLLLCGSARFIPRQSKPSATERREHD
jgi:apolipoprotein N-acyltransferase